MRAAGDRRHGRRLRALIVVLWRAGLRIHEALALSESDLDRRRGALLVRRGKGDAAARSAWTSGAGSNYRPDGRIGSSFGRSHPGRSDGGASRREEYDCHAHDKAPAGRHVEARDGVVEEVDTGRTMQAARDVGRVLD